VRGVLDGKVVAITGAGRGIGREIALRCALEGAAVIVNDPGVAQKGDGGDCGPAQTTTDDILAAGGRAHANLANVADPNQAVTIIEDAMQHFGRIDAVVNNAGILRDAIWHKMSYEDWKSVIDVNPSPPFRSWSVSRPAPPQRRTFRRSPDHPALAFHTQDRPPDRHRRRRHRLIGDLFHDP
jgi:NAD(P)-dependent dehydrogenase (short-subunit alcohol dehydrogenase family)